MKKILPLILVCIFFACEKKELPAKKYDRGDLVARQVEMGPDYKYQVWYSLSQDKIISTNLRTDWDLAFESSEGNSIFLNGSKAMKVFKTNFSELDFVTDTLGLAAHGKADMPGGNKDSTAIGSWDDNRVYVIDMGYDERGRQQGYYKLKIKGITKGTFNFEYGEIFGTTVFEGIVNKNPDYNFIAFSFSTHQQKNIEPPKTSYDLCFTQYTHLFLDPLQYYQVTGVLNNIFKTRITITKKSFSEISINDTTLLAFTPSRNGIGYDWKTFDLGTNIYTIKTDVNFIIHDNKGFYYKLHFVDFYNSLGIKGYPKFEFKRL